MLTLLSSPISLTDLATHANCTSPEGETLVKAVVDIEKSLVVIGATMHADEEEYLLDLDSEQENLWGINLYPQFFGTDQFIEYDSMINLRPSLGNRSRWVENPEIQAKIQAIISRLIQA